MQELLLKTCTSSAWRKRSLEGNCHWIVYGTGLQHSLALADLPLRKLWKRRRRHMTSSNSLSSLRHLPSTVSLGDFDQGIVRRTIAKMYCLKKVLPTIDNIRIVPKQSIGYTGSKGRLRKDLLQMKFAYTRCGVNRKVLMERQDVVLSRIRYPRRVWESREAGHTVAYTWWWLRDGHSKREWGWNLKIPSTVMKLLNKYKTKQNTTKKQQQQNTQ